MTNIRVPPALVLPQPQAVYKGLPERGQEQFVFITHLPVMAAQAAAFLLLVHSQLRDLRERK